MCCFNSFSNIFILSRPNKIEFHCDLTLYMHNCFTCTYTLQNLVEINLNMKIYEFDAINDLYCYSTYETIHENLFIHVHVPLTF